MSPIGFGNPVASRHDWYRPGPPPGALEDVRTRRVLALLIDLLLMTVTAMGFFVVLLVLGVVTFGLTWLLIPPLFPAVALIYNGLTISGRRRATPGMQAVDLEMRMMDGSCVPFLNAAAHAVFFYLSWTILTPLVLLVSLFSLDKRCLHDFAAGVIVIRRLA